MMYHTNEPSSSSVSSLEWWLSRGVLLWRIYSPFNPLTILSLHANLACFFMSHTFLILHYWQTISGDLSQKHSSKTGLGCTRALFVPHQPLWASFGDANVRSLVTAQRKPPCPLKLLPSAQRFICFNAIGLGVWAAVLRWSKTRIYPCMGFLDFAWIN